MESNGKAFGFCQKCEREFPLTKTALRFGFVWTLPGHRLTCGRPCPESGMRALPARFETHSEG